jgi:hypothetical protein
MSLACVHDLSPAAVAQLGLGFGKRDGHESPRGSIAIGVPRLTDRRRHLQFVGDDSAS